MKSKIKTRLCIVLSSAAHSVLTILLRKDLTSKCEQHNFHPSIKQFEKVNYPAPCKNHTKFPDQLPVVVNGTCPRESLLCVKCH